MKKLLCKQAANIYQINGLFNRKPCFRVYADSRDPDQPVHSQTSMARTSLGPWKFVLDKDSSSHWGLIIVPVRRDNSVMGFRSFIIHHNEAILISTHNIHFHDKIRKFPKISLNTCFLERSKKELPRDTKTISIQPRLISHRCKSLKFYCTKIQ